MRSLDVIARSEAHRDLETDPSVERYNNEIRILKRDDGTMVGSFGRNGRNAGQFHWIHAMAVDSKGNVYTAEVDTGKRVQKFKLTSDALR